MLALNAKKLSGYVQLMRLKAPIGTLLLLWPTLWGLWFAARGVPPLRILLLFVIGVVVMRSAGCVLNDITDSQFDGHVTRTQHRPLVTGKIQRQEALGLFVILCGLALVAVLFLNRLTIGMAVIALLLTVIYPFMKRVTYWPQVVLGVAFAWSVLMAYAAVTNTLPLASWVLFAITVVWTVSYDTIYAMVDRQDDILIGIKSTAIRLRQYDVLFVTVAHTVVLVGLLLFAFTQKVGLIFYPFWLVAVGLVIYQTRLIAQREPAKCFKAFLNNHWIGAVIFLGIALALP